MKANESTSRGLLMWLGALKSGWEQDSMLNKKSCPIEWSKCGTMETSTSGQRQRSSLVTVEPATEPTDWLPIRRKAARHRYTTLPVSVRVVCSLGQRSLGNNRGVGNRGE